MEKGLETGIREKYQKLQAEGNLKMAIEIVKKATTRNSVGEDHSKLGNRMASVGDWQTNQIDRLHPPHTHTKER